MKILVIEDEKLLADAIKNLLMEKGFEVETAFDGTTGEAYGEHGIYAQRRGRLLSYEAL